MSSIKNGQKSLVPAIWNAKMRKQVCSVISVQYAGTGAG